MFLRQQKFGVPPSEKGALFPHASASFYSASSTEPEALYSSCQDRGNGLRVVLGHLGYQQRQSPITNCPGIQARHPAPFFLLNATQIFIWKSQFFLFPAISVDT